MSHGVGAQSKFLEVFGLAEVGQVVAVAGGELSAAVDDASFAGHASLLVAFAYDLIVIFGCLWLYLLKG